MSPEIGEVWIVKIDGVGNNCEETAFDLVFINDIDNFEDLFMLDTDDKKAIVMNCLGESYSYDGVSEFVERVEDAEIYED